MDSSQSSRPSNAAAVRKRRSSILKSQRPPRTPFSELEFNVATPQDTSKSRRVSFSRRTGVAEFVTNEATTTWKNFYEEHNKTFESSGNESEVNGARQVIGHIGKRRFDTQFQNIEDIDFISTSGNPRQKNISISFINPNSTQADLDCISDNRNLTAPKHNFELSSLTDQQSKLFGDDLANPILGEMTNVIDINFSMVQNIPASSGNNDDLDEIQQNLQCNRNVICQGPRGRNSDSEYIEVDLNMTHAEIKNEQSDMSITDTIHSPKVQEVSKSHSESKIKCEIDWVADKENIAINPFVAPPEEDNFVVNDDSDKILVFDGKKLLLQSQEDNIESVLPVVSKENIKGTIADSVPNKPTRKTVVLNMDDDLPNFDVSKAQPLHEVSDFDDKKFDLLPDLVAKAETTVYDEKLYNIYIAQAHSTNTAVEELQVKRKTILFDENAGNISMTEVLPVSIINNNSVKRQTIVYDNGCDISITQALPSKIVCEDSNKRKTILSEESISDISVTQALPTNIITNPQKAKRQTIIYDNGCDISVTQALPSHILSNTQKEKRQTIIYDNNCDISLTQALPSNIVANSQKAKRQTIIYDNDCDISVTQAVPTNIMVNTQKEKRQTIIYENDGDISLTQAIPSNIVIDSRNKNNSVIDDIKKGVVSVISIENYTTAASSFVDVDIKKDKAVVLDNDIGDVSMTHALPQTLLEEAVKSQKRKTIVFDDNNADISMTQAIPNNFVASLKDLNKLEKSINEEKDGVKDKLEHIETELSNKSLLVDNELNTKRKTIVFDDKDGDISMTQAVPTDLLLNLKETCNMDNLISEQKTIANNEVIPELSTTQTVLSNRQVKNYIFEGKVTNEILESNELNLTNDVIAKRKTVGFNEDEQKIDIKTKDSLKNQIADMTVTQSLETNTVKDELYKIVDQGESAGDVSMTEVVPSNVLTETLNKNDITELVDDKSNSSFARPVQNDKINIISLENDGIDTPQFNDTIDKKLSISQSPNILSVPENLDECFKKYTQNESCVIDTHINNKSLSKTIPTTIETPKKDIKSNLILVCQAEKVLDRTSFKKENECSEYEIPPNQVIQPKFSLCRNLVIEEFKDNNDIVKFADVSQGATEKSLDKHVLIENNCESRVVDAKKSIMDELLDMSGSGSYEKTEDKNLMVVVETKEFKEQSQDSINQSIPEEVEVEIQTKQSNASVSNNPSDKVFFIVKDSDNEEDGVECITVENERNIEIDNKNQSMLLSNVKENLIRSIQKVINKTKNTPILDEKDNNRHYEKVTHDSEDKPKEDNLCLADNWDVSKTSKSFKEADSTKELLDMLSDFVDRRSKVYNDRESSPVRFEECLPTDNKIEDKVEILPKRKSLAPSRHSIVLNREDMLSNISMAQALLQKSRTELDLTDTIDDATIDTTLDLKSPPKKTARMSIEVVKTLQFDESMNDNSFKAEKNVTPLKKTAFGETSYMKETKAKVIPSYLKEITDDLKQLMTDLTKPATENIPFDAVGLNRYFKKSPSTCSTQIQANLVTSSQLDFETQSSSCDEAQAKHIDDLTLDPVFVSNIITEKEPMPKVISPTRRSDSKEVVLSFDPNNPLNNVMITPVDYSKTHKYNPIKTDETVTAATENIKPPENNIESNISTTYHMEIDNLKSPENSDVLKTEQSQSISTDRSDNPLTFDQYTQAKPAVVKNIEVNTEIAMKINQELLAASSSLTIVDDVLDPPVKNSPGPDSNFDIQVIYKSVKPKNLKIVESDTEDEKKIDIKTNKAKKRIYSPSTNKHRSCTLSALDITPKPVSKMQKISKSPAVFKTVVDVHRVSPEKAEKVLNDSQKYSNISSTRINKSLDVSLKSDDKSKTRSSNIEPKDNKLTTTITVQNAVTDYSIETKELDVYTKTTAELNTSSITKEIPVVKSIETISETNEKDLPITPKEMESEVLNTAELDRKCPSDSSFTSSKNIRENSSAMTVHTISSDKSKHSIWQPENSNENQPFSKLADSDASVNVVPRIDMLPFMGSPECDWEQSSEDTWSFRLLYSRIRISMRLARGHDGARRTFVRADTPITELQLEVIPQDEKIPLADACVGFAAAAMRHYAGGTGRRAGAVPGLLRRCAGVARVAVRWSRAMHAAMVRLAFKIDSTGHLSMKVANVPLRSVWEVTMKIGMVSDNKQQAPWPKAQDVQVWTVLSEYQVDGADLTRAVGHVKSDWGHAPNTIQRIFKYLKHMTQDNNLVTGLQI